MRPTLLLLCVLPILLTACGSSSRQDGPAASYVRPASGSTQVRGDYAGNPAAQAFVDRMIDKGYTEKQVRLLCEWYLRVRKSS